MATVALEIVPTSMDRGYVGAVEEAKKVKALLHKSGMTDRFNTVVVPHIIPEDSDRPVALGNKMDPLDSSRALSEELRVSYVLTQVTVFTPLEKLQSRLKMLRLAGIERVVFVGVPREVGRHPIVGPSPSESLQLFQHVMPSRGVILIPTRLQEEARFLQKVEVGATFAMTQLLFSDHVVHFLRRLGTFTNRPEVILSFGYVPKVELSVGLLRWLIRDTTDVACEEMAYVAELAALSFSEKKMRLVELYKKVIDGASGLGFPLGVHFECPYGVSEPALETFSAMLDVYTPE